MKKPLINLDWVAISVTLLPRATETADMPWQFTTPPCNRLLELPGNNIYKRRLILYNINGEKVLTLLCCPYSRVIPYNSALVEVANKWLYGGSLSWVMITLNELHPCQFLCLSRIDICGDFPVEAEEQEIINQLCGNTAYVQGYREGSLFCYYNDNPTAAYRDRVAKCMSWGSKHSNIRWKLYNKSLELTDYDKDGHKFFTKPYIIAQWTKEGFDVNRVWRLEISICPMAKYEWRGARPNLYDLCDPMYVYDLFASNYIRRYQIRVNEGHKDKRNDKKLELLDVFTNGKMTQREPAESREVAEYISGLRSAMKQLSEPSVQINDRVKKAWINTARTCVECGHLENYFNRSYGYPIAEIEYKLPDPRATL